MITTKARIEKTPRLLYIFFKLAWPVLFVLSFLYALEVNFFSEAFHRIFIVIFLLVFVLLKKFRHLFLKKVTIAFYQDRIEIGEININLPFSEIESVEFTISGYKGEVSYRGAKPNEMNGYDNLLVLQLAQGELFSINILIEAPNTEVALTKYLLGLPNCTVQRLH